MNKHTIRQEETDSPYELDFPVDPAFSSRPPKGTWEDGYRLSVLALEQVKNRPEIFEQRTRRMCSAEFQLVIGGHAVIGHGYVRATDDADIIVDRERREEWSKLMTGLGYVLDHDGGNFLQFSAPHDTGWDLDLMLASAPTFQKMLAEAKVEQIDGIQVLIPKLEHLFALKLHAAKHGPGLRKLKDLDDIIRLAIINRFDVRSESFRALCEKHGDIELYEKIVRACSE